MEKCKPWWNSHLSKLCKCAPVSFKKWGEEKNNVNLKLNYLSAQNLFSKYVHKQCCQWGGRQQGQFAPGPQCEGGSKQCC